MQITISADAVAWYGALVATGALMTNAYPIWRDRAKLVARLKADMKVSDDGPYSTEKTYLVITVGNRGRRPFTVEKAWFTLQSSAKHLLVVDSLKRGAVEVAEGKSVTYLSNQEEMDFKEIGEFRVQDVTGETWGAPFMLDGDIHLKRISTKPKTARQAA